MSPAFLPSPPLPSASRARQRNAPRCSSGPPSYPRRRFLAHAFNAALLLAGRPALSDDVKDVLLPKEPKPGKSRSARPTWGYQKENGPDAWATLSDEWTAAAGMQQSPIALSYRSASTGTERPVLTTNNAKFNVRMRVQASADVARLSLEQYVAPPPPLVGDAPPVDVRVAPAMAACVNIGDVKYVLRGVNLHVGGSEHVIDGVGGVMEAHFCFDRRGGDGEVDKDKDVPQRLIVAMMGVEKKASAPWLASMLQNYMAEANEDGTGPGIVMTLDMGDILPEFEACDVYVYSGSLTSPPCTEGVQWVVLSERMPVSKEHVDALLQLQGGPNVRPLQDTNDRRVVRYPTVVKGTGAKEEVTPNANN